MVRSAVVLPRRMSMFVVVSMLLVTASSTRTGAQTTKTYDEEHYFNWDQLSGPISEITWSFKDKARARTRTCKGKQRTKGSVSEPLSTVLFDSRTATVGPLNSTATANSSVDIQTSTSNSLLGAVRAYGSATADLSGCSSNRRKHTAVARAHSMSKVKIKYFTTTPPSGSVSGFNGTWRMTSRRTTRDGSRAVLRDPTIVRLTDAVTGQVTSWTLSDVRCVLGSGTGETRWGLNPSFPACQRSAPPAQGEAASSTASPSVVCRTLKNTAENMTFDYVIDSPVIPVNKRGTLHLVVENSIVTQSMKTGVFATLSGVPPVNASKDFEFLLGDFPYTYSLPATPNPPSPGHAVELSFDGGTHNTGLPDDNLFSDCTVVTDIGNGFDDADTSSPLAGDVDLGFVAKRTSRHVAIPLQVPAGPSVALDAVLVPVFQRNAAAAIATIQAAYVRVWSGNPMLGGTVIGGDMTTDRLARDDSNNPEVDGDMDVYRAPLTSLTASDRRLQEVLVDLDNLPLLPPGSYYLELAFDGSVSLPDPEVVPCPWSEPSDAALVFDGSSWQPARDSQSQRNLDFCATVFASNFVVGPSLPATSQVGMVILVVMLLGIGTLLLRRGRTAIETS